MDVGGGAKPRKYELYDEYDLLSLEDLDELDMWWGWKKAILPRKSFVPNQEEMEMEGEAG